MNTSGPGLALVVGMMVVAVFGATACDHHVMPTAPTQDNGAPTPGNGPGQATTFSISGTVTESAPTEQTAVGSVTIRALTASGEPITGAAVVSGADGTFTVSSVSGAIVLDFAKSGYATTRQQLAVDHSLTGVAVHMTPDGTQSVDATNACGGSQEGVSFAVHRDGVVRLTATARGFQLDYIYLTLTVSDSGAVMGQQVVALINPGQMRTLETPVTGGRVYTAVARTEACYPVDMHVEAPK
jgi:hypothetical protein